jgi:DNA-binding MarR family transcriptional regulator
VEQDPEDEHDYGDQPHRPNGRARRQQQDDQRRDSERDFELCAPVGRYFLDRIHSWLHSRQEIDCVYQLYSRSEMKASRDDVRSMVAALFVTNAALDRARRQRKGASTLSLLQVVAATPGIRPTEIAAAQDVHPSQVTRQVRELESAGLVRVTADPADRRSCRVTLTPAGVEEQARLTEEGLDRFASFVADWECEDVRMLTCLLEKLEASKAEVAAQQRPPAGRRWAGPAAD